MSLLRRKRRQNRLGLLPSPATRDVRSSLEPASTVRGLRYYIPSIRNLRDLSQRETKRLRTVIQSPFNPFTLDFNRQVKQAEAIERYNRIREIQYRKGLLDKKKVFKPVSVIRPDMSIRVDLPKEHPICIKREQRREVLFAFGKTGKSGQMPRHQDNNIKLRCK